jgi:hypothetical protein
VGYQYVAPAGAETKDDLLAYIELTLVLIPARMAAKKSAKKNNSR